MPAAYSLLGYGNMVTDRLRMEPYAQALRRAVRPGCMVLDIGAGAGIFSLLACQFGAGHVHAVEPDDSIQVAQAMAQANGFADRITFHQALSTSITLPQPADVIVSDLRGILPLFQHHIPAIIDARQRLLAPGGALIPRRDRLWAALIQDPVVYRPYVEPWLANDFGLDLSAGQPMVVNNWRNVHAKPEQILEEPQQWAVLDYHTIECTDVVGELTWHAGHSATAHGLLIWFDTELGDGIGFSNAPDQPEVIYGQGFFPLQNPVSLDPGDQIQVQIRANLVGSDYVWSWNTRVSPQNDAGSLKADFSQSTFYGLPLNPRKLDRHEASFVPQSTEWEQIDRLCLSLVDGAMPLGDIAMQVAEKFPQHFKRWEDALSHVADLLERYQRTVP